MNEFDPLIDWLRIDEIGMMGLNFLEEGGLAAVNVNGTMICIARREGKLFAIRNRCPHSGGPLHQGYLDEKGNIVCPWHRFTFCLEDGKNGNGEGFATETFPLEINSEGTFVGMPKRKKWLGLF